jgi:hypothetical protein
VDNEKIVLNPEDFTKVLFGISLFVEHGQLTSQIIVEILPHKFLEM